jgi:DNA-binding transcriptional MerR regulator
MPAIGDVARQTQLKIPTIRFYEAEALLAAPPRSPNGRRQYSAADIRRLAFIRHARAIGFELSDVRSLLDLIDHPKQPRAEVAAIARRHLDAVQERILQLNRLRTELARIVRSCGRGQSADQCSLIEALSGSECNAHQQGRKRVASVPREGTGGYAVQQQATVGHARQVGAEPHRLDWEMLRRLIESKPEFEKLFIARGLRHPHPETRWRK